MRKILLFDYEVTKYDWLIVIKDFHTKKITRVHNDSGFLKSFVKENKQNLWVGFNNHHYDDYITAAIIQDKDPYEISKKIIEDQIPGYRLGLFTGNYPSFDLKADLLDNQFLSLKEAEVYMGLSVKESSVPFDIDRCLNHQELKEMFEYCDYDVSATEQLFIQRQNDLIAKLNLINLNKYPVSDVKLTAAQISAKVLGANLKPPKYDDEFVYDIPTNLILGKYENIKNMFQTPLPQKISFNQKLAGVECAFGEGGLHGAVSKFINDKNKKYVFLDVSSYYPSIIIKYNLLSRHIAGVSGERNRYQEVFDMRQKFKYEGNDAVSNALKLVLNSAYGAMKYKFSKLYDPRMAKSIAITGQLFLTDLIDKVEPYAKLIQANTDGILLEIIDEKNIKIEKEKWEHRTQFKLDWEPVDIIYQKDVNNYYAQFEEKDKYGNPKIKLKGAYVKQFKTNKAFRNSLRIVDLAVVNFFKNGITPEKFINEHIVLSDFQILAKATSKYPQGIKEVIDGNVIKEHLNTNRVFATKNKNAGELFKYKGGVGHRIPNLPEKVFVWNDELKTIDLNKIELDHEYYINLANKRLIDFGIDL